MPPDEPWSWSVEHFRDNPTHVIRATIEKPPHCVTCGEKSPAYDLGGVRTPDGTSWQ